MYEIQSESDFQTGAAFIVKIPEEDLDKKALYTIQTEQPDFILPFKYRIIDRLAEFHYQTGNNVKLAYLSGDRSPADYAGLWSAVLQPLLICGDWFMNIYCFVLKAEYLYCDKNSKKISFIYIPSRRPCSDYDGLKSMVTEVAAQNHVTDVDLENKAVWAIQNFNPGEFLHIIKSYQPANTSQIPVIKTPESEQAAASLMPQLMSQPLIESNGTHHRTTSGRQSSPDDIVINVPSAGKVQKEKKVKKEKKDKTSKAQEKAAKAQEKQKLKVQEKTPDKRLGSIVLWSEKIISGLKKKPKKPRQETGQNSAALPEEQEEAGVVIARQFYIPPEVLETDMTQIDDFATGTHRFRYMGGGQHPMVIDVSIGEGEIFTIGRFDAATGFKQSSFEFEKRTKAVSRRHAAVERREDAYAIVDLDSAAGTFINGQKLAPNMPFILEPGCRVSFGFSGAEYVWE